MTVNVKHASQKLVGVLLRDLVDALQYRDELYESDLLYVFPVDTWVRKVVSNLWKDEFPSKVTSEDGVKYVAITKCLQKNVHPMDFNKGAWRIGIKFGNERKIIDYLSAP